MEKRIKNLILFPFNVLYKINPVFEQKWMYRLKCGHSLDLKNPVTYSEKLNWLKLYDRNPLIPKCSDKYQAREYITDCGYGAHLPKLYWHGDRAEDIPFDTLPNAFVIKSTSGSGNNIIVRDKTTINKKQIVKTAKRWLKEKYLVAYGEWQYMAQTPSILIEEYLSDGIHPVPIDYKFFCFNGRADGSVGFIKVDLDRFVSHKRNLYNTEWELLPGFYRANKSAPDIVTPKPEKLEEMIEAATVLAKPFPHCRVDFYVIGSSWYIGELTFYNGAGYAKYETEALNIEIGSWIDLPKLKND